MAVDYRQEPVHLGVFSERRRGVVLLCDQDRVLPHWLTTDDVGEATCPRCLGLAQAREDALAEMRRIRGQ